jgi:hypothetical protein
VPGGGRWPRRISTAGCAAPFRCTARSVHLVLQAVPADNNGGAVHGANARPGQYPKNMGHTEASRAVAAHAWRGRDGDARRLVHGGAGGPGAGRRQAGVGRHRGAARARELPGYTQTSRTCRPPLRKTAEAEVLVAERNAALRKGFRPAAARLPGADQHAHCGPPGPVRRHQRKIGPTGREHRPDPGPVPAAAPPVPGGGHSRRRRDHDRGR